MTLNRVQKPNMKIKKRKTTSIIMGASISHISSKFNFTAHNLAKHALQLDSESSWIEKFLTMRRIFKANSIFWYTRILVFFHLGATSSGWCKQSRMKSFHTHGFTNLYTEQETLVWTNFLSSLNRLREAFKIFTGLPDKHMYWLDLYG